MTLCNCNRVIFCITVMFTAALLAPTSTRAQSATVVQSCAKRGAKAFMRFSNEAVNLLSECEVDGLKDDERANCFNDEDVLDDIVKAADKLRREMKKCSDDALHALCPHTSRTAEELENYVLTSENGTGARMTELSADLFTRAFPACPRPSGRISRPAEDCADRISRLAEDALDEFGKCVFKCELSGMRRSDADDCLRNGQPNDTKIVECFERVKDDIDGGLEGRCNATTLVELGCPMGQAGIERLADELTARLFEETRRMSDEIFFSSCGRQGGGTSASGETEPIPATLHPSQTAVRIDCGQTLDPAFFGADNDLRLGRDLDCSPAGVDSIGLIVSASNVTVSGRSEFSLTGPSRTSNRTGTGILIAPGATGVTIRDFRSIQRYAVGIADSGSNDGLHIERSTIRRNRVAGVVTTSPNVVVDQVKADRNGIGFQMSGDGSTLIDSQALRSAPDPAVGIQLMGTDEDGNGRIVRVNRCKVEENAVGVVIVDGPHLLENNEVRLNLGYGIHALSSGSKLESNSVKLNLGTGLVIDGDSNNVTANRSDENGGYGYLVTGSANIVDNNGAGSLTGHGNALAGYRFVGVGSIVETNDAEANLGAGFIVDEVTSVFKSNGASANAGIGFDVNYGGNTLDTNMAEDNGGFEFSIAADNLDRPNTNRKNGVSFAFSLAGGNFE